MANNILQFWQNSGDDPFEVLFRAAPIMMHSIDRNGVLLRVSQFWASKLGYQIDEMVGRSSTDFLTDESQKYAKRHVLPRFFAEGMMNDVEYDFVCKDGTILAVKMSAMAQFDHEGEFERSLAIMFDNTESKKMSRQLVQSQRSDAIGRLVGGVAHDFNNLLTVILGNIDFLGKAQSDEERGQYLANAKLAAMKGATLTQQLLAYGRKANLSPELVDLNRAIADMDRLLQRVIPERISISTVGAAGLWKVEVDPSLLDTTILNLVNNARDAMPSTGGKLTIETSNVRISNDYVTTRDETIPAGRYVLLAISDNGMGMSPEVQHQVFEPFFTTKSVGQGSGLGLSMVYGFVRQSNGAIRVYSEEGVGSTFKIYFPAVVGAKEDDFASNRFPAEGKDGIEIEVLVVEDQEDVRDILVKQIAGQGLHIVQCATGDEALEVMNAGLRPKILVTDIVMPGTVQGPELAERAREVIDDLHVVYVSGFPTEAVFHGKRMESDDLQFVKPVDSNELREGITQLINKVRSSPG